MRFVFIKLFFVFIVVLAFILRFYNLSFVPVGFHEDEAQIGYNSYSLLQTGKDKNGVSHPISIDQFGDFRPAGYHYLDIPAIAIFGLNEFATRFPAALIGVLSILIIFYITKLLFENNTISLISASLLAISPWHIVVSRASSESVISLFLILLGLAFFIQYIKKEKSINFLILSALFLILSFFFYHSARFFIPIFVIFASFVYVRISGLRFDKKMIPLVIFNSILFFSSIVILVFSQGDKRLNQVSIFSNPETQLVLNEEIREDGSQNTIITRFIHNKFINYSQTFSENYFKHFSGEFLFMRGGLPSRYIIPETGLFYPLLAPILIIGFVFLFLEALRKNYSAIFILLWIFIGPIPSALTWEDIPNIQRSIMMLVPLIITIAFGINKIVSSIDSKYKTKFIIIFLALITYNFIFFFHMYFFQAFYHRPWERSVGENELVFEVNKLIKSDEKAIMTKANANNIIFFLFYLKIDPRDYQVNKAINKNGNIVYKNMTFTDIDCPASQEKKLNNNTIYVNRGECPDTTNAKLIKKIYRTDGTLAFKILKSWD